MSTFPGYLTVNEAAEAIDRSHSQVTRYITSGLLRAIKQGNQWFIPEEQLKGFEPPPRGNPVFREQSAK